MEVNRRHVFIALSVAYLVALMTLAAYALHSSHVYALPIANIISALAVALPPLAGVGLETIMSLNQRLASKGQIQGSRVFQITIAFFLVYEAVIATLAGIHISPPGSLDCHLREQWKQLYRVKDATHIRRIQDTFSCCGLQSVKDMAFPFPHGNHGADSCVLAYGRDRACLQPWRGEERKAAIMLLIVPVAVFIWQVIVVLAPSSESAWRPSRIRLPEENGPAGGAGGGGGRRRQPRPAIGYRDVEETGDEDSINREVDALNSDSRLASQVEGNRVRPGAGLYNEANQWRESRNTEA